MRRVQWISVVGLIVLAAAAPAAQAQRPYIGYVFPAGGQQGTTFQIRLGGQNLGDVGGVVVSGPGVQAKVTDYFRRLDNQELGLIRDQLAELRKAEKAAAAAKEKAAAKGNGVAAKGTTPAAKDKDGAATAMDAGAMAMDAGAMSMDAGAMGMGAAGTDKGATAEDEEARTIIARIDKRLAEYVQTPANASISSLVFVEVTMASDAAPGRRELRLVTSRGVSNPLVFHVGQVPEVARTPLVSCRLQVLGKEEQALRKRPPEQEEATITVPCTANGQIAPGEVNRYRFEARKGQRLLVSVEARGLNPYVADAVPGWFQPVLTLRNAAGKEVAFCDDYRFKPDPVIFFEVPEDGAYVLSITDAIYRGREDFVYRVTIGEMPFLAAVFPLGGRAGEPVKFEMAGWNLAGAALAPLAADAGPGVRPVTASKSGLVSNCLPVETDTLPEAFDKESNNDRPSAQKVELPVIVNGRIDRPDDWDVFQFTGKAGDTVVAEVGARRLDSPLDSVLKLTDVSGTVLAANDDHEDPEAGVNTHHADSYLMFKLPADGTYCVHIGDAARAGGPVYAYRLRLSRPMPDFALYVVPSSLAMRGKSGSQVNIQVVRKDGFTGPISLALKDPPEGFSIDKGTIGANQATGRVTLSTKLTSTPQPVSIRLEGKAKIEDRDVVREVVFAEDRMQAFLWRHLVPAQDLKVLVFDPSYVPPPKRIRRLPALPADATKAPLAVAAGPKAPTAPAVETKAPAATPAGTKAPAAAPAASPAGAKAPAAAPAKPMFTKQQVAGRLRTLKVLFEEGLITEDFYDHRVAECEAAP